jgi:hypothetical protein
MSPYASLRFSAFATLMAAWVLVVRRSELAEQWLMVVFFVLLALNTWSLWRKRNQESSHD